jgi:hypothetical protein
MDIAEHRIIATGSEILCALRFFYYQVTQSFIAPLMRCLRLQTLL